MSKVFKEDGNLSDYGNATFKAALDGEVKLILGMANTEAELQIIGSLLLKRVADLISEQRAVTKQFTSKLDKMTDDQFEAYLKIKYGARWPLQTLRTEELERSKRCSFYRKLEQSDLCTGHWWHDEYGQSSFMHDDHTYCPVHDKG